MDENVEQKPLINILIRTSNRPSYFRRCLESVVKQSYPNIRIIVSYDNEAALRYIPKGLEAISATADKTLPFFYDEFCNQLSALVEDGYYVFLDDDDRLIDNDVLSRLPLIGNGLVVQLQRGTNIVPKDLNFKSGQIGLPCLILHYSLKNIARIHPNGQGDSHWIRSVLNKVEIPFVPIVVVYSQSRGLGMCNG